jgi:fumarate hydratase, class I
MYDEKNTGTNLPAQIDLHATDGDAYTFLFIAKGAAPQTRPSCFSRPGQF